MPSSARRADIAALCAAEVHDYQPLLDLCDLEL